MISIRIAIYSRKSVYTGKGESIGNQVEMCRQYIENRIDGGRSAVTVVYEDEGFSGKNLDRPQFQRMLSDSRKQKLDYIICYRLDRISRSVGDFAPLIEDLIAREIGFVCIKEQFDTSTPMGKAMMYIASVFAQLERETIAERVRDNMLMLARSGRWLGGPPPTGFLSEKLQEVVLDGKVKTACKLKWNPEEIETAKMIYEKFLELQSVSGIGKFLMRAGVKSRTGKFFSLPGIREILSNPVYSIADKSARAYFVRQGSDVCFPEEACSGQYGLLSYNKRDYSKQGAPRLEKSQWIIAIGKHRGIIRGQDWVRVQEILESKQPEPRERNMHNDYSLLSGTLVCKKCGSRMFAKPRSNSNGLFDYICDRKLRGGAAICDCRNLNGQRTDELVCQYLSNRIQGDSGIRALLEQLRQKFKAEDQSGKVDTLNKIILKAETELGNLAAAMSQPNLSPALVKRASDRAGELDRQISECRKELEQLQACGSPPCGQDFHIGQAARNLSSLKYCLTSLSIHEKRELVRLLVQRIEWDGESIDLFLYG